MIPGFSESVSFRDSRDILIPPGRLKISEPHPEEPPVRNRPKRVDGSVLLHISKQQDYIDKAHVPLARSQAACRPRTWSVQ